MFGSRRPVPYGDEGLDAAQPGTAVEVRPGSTPLERAEAAAERRAFQAGLEQLLHREIRSAVSLEVGELRSEIAALRSELLEKVGGQIRLERIETTRVIGSDLEALQQEVRQLKTLPRSGRARTARRPSIVTMAVSAEPPITPLAPAAATATARRPAPRRADEPAAAQPGGRARPARARTVRRVHCSDPAVARDARAADRRRSAAGRGRVRRPPRPRPNRLRRPRPNRLPPRRRRPSRLPAEPFAPEDPFAGLPRIRPFTDFALDPIEPPAPEPPHRDAGPCCADERQRSAVPAPAARRARTNRTPLRTGASGPGGTPAGTGAPRRATPGQELLAKLLAREGS